MLQSFGSLDLLLFLALLLPVYNDHYNGRGGLLDHYKLLALAFAVPAALASAGFCPCYKEEGKSGSKVGGGGGLTFCCSGSLPLRPLAAAIFGALGPIIIINAHQLIIILTCFY